MINDDLRAKLARFGYTPPEIEEAYDADPIKPIDTHPGTRVAISPEDQADKLEQRLATIRAAADLCASDPDWFSLFEAFVDEALTRE